MIRLWALGLLILTAGCSRMLIDPGDAAAAARTAWEAMALEDYRYDFQRQCFCGAEALEPVTITVRDDVVVAVRSRVSGERLPLTGFITWPTFEDLLAQAEEARKNGEEVTITYGPGGFTSRIEIGSLAADAGVIYLTGGFQELE